MSTPSFESLSLQTRHLEQQRRRYNDDSLSSVHIHRRQIEKLKHDNDRLKEDLALETRQARQANNVSNSAHISRMQDQSEHYARLIEKESAHLEDLDKRIEAKRAEIKKLRSERKKEGGDVDATRAAERAIRLKENQLDKALVKYNEALALNRRLRKDIDNLRRERVMFDDIYHSLAAELNEKKSNMADIIGRSNDAFQSRDEAQSEMATLKARADKEQQEFEERWAELAAQIERDRQNKQWLASGGGADSAEGQMDRETVLKDKIAGVGWKILTYQFQIDEGMKSVQDYEEAFARIQKATHLTDVDRLVDTFIGAEEKNFELFRYVNRLSNEEETLEESNAQLEAEIDKYKTGAQSDQRCKAIQTLRKQLSGTRAETNSYVGQQERQQNTVRALKRGIQNLYKQVCEDCWEAARMTDQAEDEQVVDQNALRTSAGITDGNMLDYVGLIEQRVVQLLGMYTESAQQ